MEVPGLGVMPSVQFTRRLRVYPALNIKRQIYEGVSVQLGVHLDPVRT